MTIVGYIQSHQTDTLGSYSSFDFATPIQTSSNIHPYVSPTSRTGLRTQVALIEVLQKSGRR
jgi:hypothetical protein